MSIKSTREFIIKTLNLVSREEIKVTNEGNNRYSFSIHHLSFLYEENVAINKAFLWIRSSLENDGIPYYTDMWTVTSFSLYNILTILEYNYKHVSSHHMTINAMMRRIRFSISVSLPSTEVFSSTFFKIVHIPKVGLVFKQADSAGGVHMAIGRIMESMGTDVIALFGYLHEDVNNRIEHNTTATAKMEGCTMHQTLFEQEFNSAVRYENQDQHPYYYVKKNVLRCMDETKIRQSATMHFTPYSLHINVLTDVITTIRVSKMDNLFDLTPLSEFMKIIFDEELKKETKMKETKATQSEDKILHKVKEEVVITMTYSLTNAFLQSKNHDQFTANICKSESKMTVETKRKVISIRELLRDTGRLTSFARIVSKDKALSDLAPNILRSSIIIRWSKDEQFSIGENKFKDHDLLVHFLADTNNIIGLFCGNKQEEKKTEQQVKLEEIKKYVDSKIVDVRTSRTYRSKFKMLDFLTDNHLWMDLNDKLQKTLDETPGMHLFNSVPESVSIEYEDGGAMEHTQNIYVSCSYNQQDNNFSPIKVFRDESAMLEWLMDPINLVKKFDKDGKLVTEKQTNLCKRTMFDTALNEYLRSNTSIPYKKGIVYHPINLKDFAMWYCGKKGGHDNQLLDIFNAPTVHLGNYRFFVDNGEARNSNQYLYSLRAMSTDTTSINWTTNVTDIFSFLFDNYVKSGHA